MVLDRLEAILNRNVADSRRAQTLARQLDGRVMSLAAEGTPVTIYLRAEGGRLALTPRHDGTTDASISGTPIALLALAGPRGEGALRGGGVRIEGDAEVAERFRDLLAETRPDFEEELSRVIGDVAARQVSNLARGLLEWGRRTSASFAGSVAEYLQEEGRDLPSRTEVDEFLSGVDRLRDDAERLEARLARLESAAARTARG
jgi:ubiquinone biosynthesis protein UbiJ